MALVFGSLGKRDLPRRSLVQCISASCAKRKLVDQSFSKQKQESTAAAQLNATNSSRAAARASTRTVAAFSIALLMKALDFRLALNLRPPLCVCVSVRMSRLVLLLREETELLVVYLIYNYRYLVLF